MSPAERIIDKCGAGDRSRGVAVVAEIAGVHRSRVHRWTYPKSKGGTDGLVPSQHQQPILTGARARGIEIEPADFFEGAGNGSGDGTA